MSEEDKNIELAVKWAIELWKDVLANKAKLIKLNDENKMNFYLNNSDFIDFLKSYPIVARYAICMGEFSKHAFERYVKKIASFKPPRDKQMDKAFMENEKLKRHADYVRYLFEAKNKHYNRNESNWVWNDTYTKLKGEHDDFKNREKEIEKQIKAENTKHKQELASEFLQKLKENENEAELSEESAKILYYELENLSIRKTHKSVMSELLDNRERIAHCSEGYGIGTESKKPTIKMIAS